MIAVDTNLVAYLFIKGEHSGAAEKVLRKDPIWAAPPLWRSEFRSVLAACLRKGFFGLDDGARIMKEAESLMKGNEFAVDSFDVLSLAAVSGCSAYDCEFVALARGLDVRLVTTDKALLKSFPDMALSPARFLAG
jgi:predicted nucleic acid-binding protein